MLSHRKISEMFWKRAKEHAEANGGWYEVERDSHEHKAWAAYFRLCGWWPLAMRRLEYGALSRLDRVVMPAQWPEWFDPQHELSAGDPLPEPKPDLPSSPQMQARMAELFKGLRAELAHRRLQRDLAERKKASQPAKEAAE